MRQQVQYRLLIVRLGAMGDILHALPAVTALREAHPSWIIDWAVDPKWRALLTSEALGAQSLDPSGTHTRGKSRPLVDTVHEVPSKAWGNRILSRQTRGEIRTLRARLKAASYDAVLDFQGAVRSAVIARLSGCHRIIGEAHPRETPARWLFTELVETLGVHVIEQDIELASAVAGDLLIPTDPWLPVDEEAEDWCDQHEEIRRAEWTGKPIVLLHPGAGWGAKRWPAERYAMVAKEFARRGAVVLVNAGPGEESLAEIAAGMTPHRSPIKATEPIDSSQYDSEHEVDGEHRVIDEFAAVFAHEGPAQPAASLQDNAAGDGAYAKVVQSTLPQLISLTRRSTLVIGGDTGPLHLASALGKPVVGIFGPTDPKRNGPFGSRSRVLRNPDSRRDHTRREQTEAGLLTITPEAVIDAALTLMIEQRSEQQRVKQTPFTGSAPAKTHILQAYSGDVAVPEYLPENPATESEIGFKLDPDSDSASFQRNGRP